MAWHVERLSSCVTAVVREPIPKKVQACHDWYADLGPQAWQME